jgi:hypothetical protein
MGNQPPEDPQCIFTQFSRLFHAFVRQIIDHHRRNEPLPGRYCTAAFDAAQHTPVSKPLSSQGADLPLDLDQIGNPGGRGARPDACDRAARNRLSFDAPCGNERISAEPGRAR